MASSLSVYSDGAVAVPSKRGISGIIMTGFAAFGGMLFGYDTGTIAGVIQMGDWIRTFGEPDSGSPTGYSVSTSRESLVVSILSAGTFLGASISTLSSMNVNLTECNTLQVL